MRRKPNVIIRMGATAGMRALVNGEYVRFDFRSMEAAALALSTVSRCLRIPRNEVCVASRRLA